MEKQKSLSKQKRDCFRWWRCRLRARKEEKWYKKQVRCLEDNQFGGNSWQEYYGGKVLTLEEPNHFWR